ncbi:fibronectin type III domain protein [Tenacibaculum skagerrakense]|uniref:Fibronectin type III domain protein n=1 Tax=Tenacibaculum skagerrakense TaxID=186571 RepID=A0A4R2NSI6_9FLAO|nr:DNA/RNA non-specific endonuclease [Tenacibaculum skagerrakense]TCP24807.1 fibronectin type III domain protein [Tenacibaculum skagerrakense]
MKRKVLLSLFSFVLSINVFAQQYPVNIIPRVKAPAPVNFYNYADETALNGPITIQIFLNDLTVSSRQVRLKTYFEGGNISFSSRDFVIGAQDLFIEGGIPLTLTNVELAPYYRFENIQGIGQSVYAQSIPEGTYNFCFEVYDFLSGAKLSDKKCATVFIFKNEPPILNLPFNGKNIEPSDFENIVFQWTPRHINVSNVEYDFSIVEIWDNNVDPQTAFLSQAPIYEETVRTTSLFYGPDKPLLLAGRKYAWRVRARALQGLEEIGLFKNEGYSEIFWFSRTAPCQIPEGISGEPKGTSKINVFWDQDPTLHSEYIIAYREANNPDANWFTKKTNSAWATIWDLKPGTAYEFKVKGKCAYQYSEYSEPQYVTTDIVQNEDANYNCGIVPDEIAISNRDPHPGLNIGDQITAGDFKVTITEIQSQSNGVLSGKGFVAIPYLKFAKFGVTFSNILVNTDAQLAEGEIVTLYDPEFGEGASMTVDVNINISEGIGGDPGDLEETVEVGFEVATVVIDANGAIVVTGTNGETAIIPGDGDVNIVSTNGDIWAVGEDGTITKQEGAQGGVVSSDTTNGLDSNGNVTAVTAKGVTIDFQSSGFYHFDELPENTSATFEKEYKILDTESGKYRVPYKAISDNEGEDFVTAKVTITDTSIVKDSIIFKTKDGAKVPVEWIGDIAKLQLKRKFDYADEEIFAVVKSKDNGKYDIAGSLVTTHLASQQLEPINVTIVPVFRNIASSEITEKLKILKKGVTQIYNKSGVKLNIQFSDNVSPEQIYGWDKDGDKRLSVGDSNLLSHYTDEELVFNSYIKQQTYYNNKTYYVFVTNVSVTKTEVEGFMPLKRQFGYVFTANSNNELKQIRTMAHELGHGIFGLKHTWDEYQFPQGATDNLMDYGNGTTLNHLDWKKIHAPGIKIYWFQGDEEGQNTVVSSIPKEFANPDKTFTFLTVNGSFITLPENVTNLSFITGIDKFNPYVFYPTGALQSFKLDEVSYHIDVETTEVEDKYTVDSFNFTYKGFKNYDAEDRNKYHGTIITVAPDGDGRKLLKTKIEELAFNENEIVNILKPNTYNKFKKATLKSNRLNEKIFAYGEETPYDPSYKLNQDLVQDFMGENIEWNNKYFIVSKFAFLNNSYPELVKDSYSELKFTSSIPAYKNNIYTSKRAYTLFQDSEITIENAITIYLEMINALKDKQKECLDNLLNITPDTGFNQVKNCITSLSDQELEKLSVENKITAISILTPKNGPTNNSSEIQIIRLLRFTKDADVDNLLTALLGKSKLYEDEFILKRLAYKIDNDHIWLTDDNYKEFVNTLSQLCGKSKIFKETAIGYTDDEFADRIINFYHKGFWDYVKELGANSPVMFFYVCNMDTKIDWVSDESVKLSAYNEMTCNLLPITQDEPVELGPLDPIWFVNKSSLSMLSDYNKETPIIAPAMLAYYANDVGNTKNTVDGIEAAIDVVSLATGVGALAKAPTTLRKVFIIADMIGSGVNIILSSSSENLSPNAKKVLEALNVLTAIIAVDELLIDGTISIKKLYKKVAKQNTKPLPSKNQINDFINSVLNQDLTNQQLAEIGANKLREAEKWLDNVIAEGKISGELELAVRARTAKAKIEAVKKLLKIDAKHLQKSIVDLSGPPPVDINKVKNFIDNGDDYVDVIIHADDTGKGFSMVIEIDGVAETVTLSATEFARSLKNVPESKKIRLLSCNDTESAKEIASVLGREIIGSSGEMRIYENGVVKADDWYSIKPNGKIDPYSVSSSAPSGEFLMLKKKFVDNLPTDIVNDLTKMLGQSKFDEFAEMLTRSKLPGTWKLQKSGDVFTLIDKQGKVWAEISNGVIKAKAGGKGDGWNHLLNVDPPLMKGFRYEIENGKFIYEIDDLGRVVSAKMNSVSIDKSIKRSEDFQSHTKTVKDGSTVNVDDGGHIFRNEWGGLSEQINYFSQNAKENRTGAWYNMEKAISNMLKSDNPPTNINIEMDFNFIGNSKRPDSIDVIVKVDGKIDTQLSRSYDNPL